MFVRAIKEMGRVVMVLSPWDNPIALTRAWCLIELYACCRLKRYLTARCILLIPLCSTGGRFDIALPDEQRAQFLSDIRAKSSAFYDMLALVKTERSECSRLEDRDRIFEAVRSIDGGFSTVDRMVFKAM